MILADTQRTSLAEQWLLRREDNSQSTLQLLRAVAAEQPVLVALVGDAVFNASAGSDWRWFNAAMSPLRHRRTPVLLAMGNHEYWGPDLLAWHHVTTHFPQIAQQRWYWRRVGPLALVWLDSNARTLGVQDWQRQRRWFRSTLQGLDARADIRHVIVCSHHPPYTNSTTGAHPVLRDDLVGDFRQARKAQLWVSGHAHGYERLRHHDKWFVVSGGGGGPRAPKAHATRTAHPDHYTGPWPCPLHYLAVTTTQKGFTVHAKGLTRTFDTFTVPSPE